MTAVIIERWLLPGIPAASGIEILEDTIYIIGDNSPFLFRLAMNREITGRIALVNIDPDAAGKIPKADKPDLEALAIVRNKKKKLLLALGSGSIRGKRDTGFIVDLEKDTVTKIPLLPLYDRIRNVLKEWDAGELNIEGAVFRKGWLHLLQRGNISGKNIIITISWKDFIHYPQKNLSSSFSARQVLLPEWNGIKAGFSGACLIPDSNDILFTASLEDTPNAIDDGPSLGSFIGKLHFSKYPEKNPLTVRIMMHQDYFRGKIESIAVLKVISANEIETLAITDNDEGLSELLKVRVTF